MGSVHAARALGGRTPQTRDRLAHPSAPLDRELKRAERYDFETVAESAPELSVELDAGAATQLVLSRMLES
jgi:hypothetical protein